MSRLIDISNEINALIALKEYRIINFMLNKAMDRLPSMSSEMILTFISASHPVKEHLDVWPKYMERVKEQFKARNLDYTRLQLYLNKGTK